MIKCEELHACRLGARGQVEPQLHMYINDVISKETRFCVCGFIIVTLLSLELAKLAVCINSCLCICISYYLSHFDRTVHMHTHHANMFSNATRTAFVNVAQAALYTSTRAFTQ